MSRRFRTFAPNFEQMVTELLVVWVIAVVAFFALWAILLKVIKRISEKKGQAKAAIQEEATEEKASTESET